VSNNIRLQNLRDFTVQIRHPVTDAIVGTGIVVSTDGKVVTCAHVVEAALGTRPRDANGLRVGVYFSQYRGSEEKLRQAQVVGCFDPYDDDVVLLQLVNGASPLAPEQIAILGAAELSEGNPFLSYGYSPIGEYPATRAEGTIMGTIEPPPEQRLRADPVQLRSRRIAPGMSGAAVPDVEQNLQRKRSLLLGWRCLPHLQTYP
jgi:hypothetical protein